MYLLDMIVRYSNITCIVVNIKSSSYIEIQAVPMVSITLKERNGHHILPVFQNSSSFKGTSNTQEE